MTVTEVAELYRMPVKMLKQWRDTGTFEGIEHPVHKLKSGLNVEYDADSVKVVKGKLSRDNYYPEPAETPDVWSGKLFRKHRYTEVLAAAIINPATIRVRGGDQFTITATYDLEPGAVSAYSIIGRKMSDLKNVTRIESRDMFPGVQFLVE